MQNSQYRCVILAAVLGVGYTIAAGIDRPESGDGRWPAEDAVYAVDGWAVSRATVENAWGVHSSSRRFAQRGGTTAWLTIRTSPDAKQIYRVGAELPFLGSGATVEPPPPTLTPQSSGRSALLVRRESDLVLVLYAYGERRGLVGNGPAAWGLMAVDAVLGRPNDYYQLSLQVPLDRLDSPKAQEAMALADELFPRLAAWYGESAITTRAW
jgi:hypothetical protein